MIVQLKRNKKNRTKQDKQITHKSNLSFTRYKK